LGAHLLAHRADERHGPPHMGSTQPAPRSRSSGLHRRYFAAHTHAPGHPPLHFWRCGPVLEITDTYIELDHPVDWSGIPTATLDLLPAARPLSAPAGRQTLFQQNLPVEFQVKPGSRTKKSPTSSTGFAPPLKSQSRRAYSSSWAPKNQAATFQQL
jgi:hypothetical protein